MRVCLFLVTQWFFRENSPREWDCLKRDLQQLRGQNPKSTFAHSDTCAQLRIHTHLTVRKFSWKNNFPYYYTSVLRCICTNSYQLIIIVLFWIETVAGSALAEKFCLGSITFKLPCFNSCTGKEFDAFLNFEKQHSATFTQHKMGLPSNGQSVDYKLMSHNDTN